MRNKNIKIFYHPLQVLKQDPHTNYSKSPQKPKKLIEFLKKNKLSKFFKQTDKFLPFTKQEFKIAHTEEYVNDFFEGTGKHESNSLKWSKQFVESVCYTNGNLYSSILNSINHPQEITLSPTSGFHHAKPNSGEGFCTFSGQVIASMKIYKDLGLTGAYIDLDGHFGNSIEDSREFVPELNKAIPIDCNINPKGEHETYIEDLKKRLKFLETRIRDNAVHYLVWCHGADSHQWDDLGFQLNTEEWLTCSIIFYKWVKNIDEKLKRPIPITLSLFGGYRKDHYDSVLSLHSGDLVECLNILCNRNIVYKIDVKERGWSSENNYSNKSDEKISIFKKLKNMVSII